MVHSKKCNPSPSLTSVWPMLMQFKPAESYHIGVSGWKGPHGHLTIPHFRGTEFLLQNTSSNWKLTDFNGNTFYPWKFPALSLRSCSPCTHPTDKSWEQRSDFSKVTYSGKTRSDPDKLNTGFQQARPADQYSPNNLPDLQPNLPLLPNLNCHLSF